MKRTFVFALILMCIVFCIPAACSAAVYPGTKVNDQGFSITAYWGPDYEHVDANQATLMRKAKLDTIAHYRDPWGQEENGSVNYGNLTRAVNVFGNEGINVSLNDGRLTQELMSGDIEKGVKRLVEEANWPSYANVTEIYLCDEPNASQFARLQEAVSTMRKYYPAVTTYINLLPSYATSEQYGTETYEEYVNTFASTVKPDYLCFDYYAFLRDGTMRTGLIENFETMRKASEANGNIPLRFIAQCSASVENNLANVTRDELSWEANVALMYGVEQLGWYTWAPTGGEETDMLVGEDYLPTQHYYDVKAINPQIKAMGNALMKTKVKKVFYVGDVVSGIDAYSSYGKLGKLKSAGNLLLGFYQDSNLLFAMNSKSSGDASVLSASNLSKYCWLNPSSQKWEDLSTCPYYKGNTLSIPAGNAVLLNWKAVPKATSIKALTKGKKSLKVSWKKASDVSGYQIRYSTKSSMKSSKTVKVSGNKTFKKTVKKLKAKKKYYVQIRTYKKINGKTFYSSWSKKKSARTK